MVIEYGMGFGLVLDIMYKCVCLDIIQSCYLWY